MMSSQQNIRRMGWIGMPIILIIDVLAPIAECISYVLLPILFLLGRLDVMFMISYFAFIAVMGIFVSLLGLTRGLSHSTYFPRTNFFFVLSLLAIFETLGYRQLVNSFRFVGYFRYLINRQHWGELRRTG